MQSPKLPIHNMAQRHHGLIQEVAEYWTQAARVCLDRHHQPPVVFKIVWAERSGTQASDLENCIRLEISGVDHGNVATVARRLDDKLEQAASGNSNLPAIAGVVGFRAQLIQLANLEE